MTPPEPAHEAAVLVLLTDVKDDVKAIRDDMAKMPERYVPRGEWDQRNQHVNTHLQTQGREIGQLRAELQSRRAPWWSTWTVALAVAGLVWSILGPAIRGG